MLIPDPSVLGSVVRKRRVELGMSQTELAQKVGTTRQWLSRFEQNSNDVSVSIIFAILKELDLELSISGLPRSTQDTTVPDHGVQPLPVQLPAVAAESATDRFALLRSRDALAGLRMPRGAHRDTDRKQEPEENKKPDHAAGPRQEVKSSYQMDLDIARIKKSSLFRR